MAVPRGGAVCFGPGGLCPALLGTVMDLCGSGRFPVTLRFAGGDVTAMFSVNAVGGSLLGEGPLVVPAGARNP